MFKTWEFFFNEIEVAKQTLKKSEQKIEESEQEMKELKQEMNELKQELKKAKRINDKERIKSLELYIHDCMELLFRSIDNRNRLLDGFHTSAGEDIFVHFIIIVIFIIIMIMLTVLVLIVN